MFHLKTTQPIKSISSELHYQKNIEYSNTTFVPISYDLQSLFPQLCKAEKHMFSDRAICKSWPDE